ncbi:SusC/RagA family TonB-linked outer membrane protein [Pedobacter jejuensis]|uniref:SusC/RagA family TonB-linked outer membrane protein n=1 Tax=Pedobacter jejuensis TaxID=1268550 RepID=A0A3N0BNX2_9SPHI|nr:SusC/RagA family TonB-linked outer membrane protein [Pedobacter jejuensis]RNL50552.1 SusC/RagA family TonB-linked outer membrane protein [Pedobacter jejuensis]
MKKLLQSLFIIMFFAVTAMAQDRTITGTVTSADDKQPIPGVSVKIQGAAGGASTNAQGKFSIKVGTSAKTILFSSIGYVEQAKTIGTSDVINAVLATDSKQLNEVVVTSFGVIRQARSLGASVGKVNNEQITQVSEPDVLKTLQGKVAGVDIRASQGTPGAATRIQIRGNTSFTGDAQPLIVVDRVPYSNDQVTTSNQLGGGGAYGSGFSNIDPNDIASIQVLKGSGAAALYGSRASNGVLLITTKSGSATAGKKGLEISLKSSVSLEQIAGLPELQNSFGTGSYGNYSASNGSWGPKFGGTLKEIPAWPAYLAAYPELFPTGKVPYQAYPDNVSSLFKDGYVFENSINLNGGNEKSAFVVTASQLDQSGYVTNSNYNRTNIAVGGSSKLDMGLNIRGNLSYSRSTQEGGFYGETQNGAPSLFSRSLFLGRNWDLSLPFEDKNGNSIIYAGAGQFDNPLWSAKYNTTNTAEERFIANIKADYDITKWANFSVAAGTNVNSLARREVIEVSSRAAEGLGRLTLDDYRKQEIESTALLNLKPKINDDFSFNGLLGFNFNQRTSTRQVDRGNQFIERGIHNLNNTVQQSFLIDSYQRRRIFGVFAEATFGYKNYAFITATGRNDWSSTLPVDNRSYFYPAISGTFIFTDAFKIKSKVLDYGKLRVSYAKVGRDASPYGVSNGFSFNTNFLSVPNASANNKANDPNLKPEFTKEFETGTELSFFSQRINFDFTYYNKISTNLIQAIDAPASSGYEFYNTNIGQISNKGVEIQLTAVPVRTTNFNWNLSLAYTRNKNMVDKLKDGVSRIDLAGFFASTGYSAYAEAGMPYGYLRGSTSARDNEGNLLVDPATGALIDNTEPSIIGDPNPKYKLGFTNTFSYKGISLGVLLDFTKGGSVYSTTIQNELGRGTSKLTEDRETTWVIPGVYGNPNTFQPILDANGNKIQNITRITTNSLYFNGGGASTFATNGADEWSVYDGTVFRLREISLGYTLPKALFKKTPIGSIRVSLTGRNLWFYTPNIPKGTNFDPETNSFGATNIQGIELSTAPTVKRYGFNINITF